MTHLKYLEIERKLSDNHLISDEVLRCNRTVKDKAHVEGESISQIVVLLYVYRTANDDKLLLDQLTTTG